MSYIYKNYHAFLMVKKEELFVLIKSLSKSEKRYFNMFCLQFSNKNANYLKLFKAIAKQDVYNEDKIKEEFKNETFLKQLHVTKNYLRNLILKSLRNFHSDLTKNIEVKELLQNIEILYRKELFIHCKNELKRAKIIAEKYELNNVLFEILSWERKLIQATQPAAINDIEIVINKQRKVTNNLVKIIDYWELALHILSSPTNDKILKITNHKLLQTPDFADTLETKILYYHNLYYYHLITRKSKEAGKALHSLITFFESDRKYITHNLEAYITTVNNYITYLIFTKKLDKVDAYLRKVKTLFVHKKKGSTNKIVMKHFYRTLNIELELYKDGGLTVSKNKEIKFIEDYVKENELKIPKEYLFSFWFQMASINFTNKNFSATLFWVNKLLKFKRNQSRIDLFIQGRMLNLLVHFELKNYFTLGYFIDSTSRFLKKNGEVNAYQKIIFQFMHKVINVNTYSVFDFEKLKTSLKLNTEESLISKDVLDYIDYGVWIDSHI